MLCEDFLNIIDFMIIMIMMEHYTFYREHAPFS